MISIIVSEDDFDVGEQYRQLREKTQGDGAIVTFTGLVRDFGKQGNIVSLHLEHYAEMTEKTLLSICNKAKKKWTLGHITVIHRVGHLQAFEHIVFVGVTSQHRESAFNATEFIMDYLKTEAPFWKSESTLNDTKWVEAKKSDATARQRWK